MFHAESRPSTATSDRVSSAEPTGPAFSARAAPPTALRYWAAPNFGPGSPRPTTSTRGAATPARSWSIPVRPVLPLRSPRESSAFRRPPLAASIAWAAGVRLPSDHAPTTTQSVLAVAASWLRGFRLNSRVIREASGVSAYNRLQRRAADGTLKFKAPRPDAPAGPLSAARIHPGHLRHAGGPADGQPGRHLRRRPGADRQRQGAGLDAALADGAADHPLPAHGPAAGLDAGAAAGRRAPVPGRGNAGAGGDWRRAASPAAPPDAAGPADGRGDRDVLVVAGALGQGHF